MELDDRLEWIRDTHAKTAMAFADDARLMQETIELLGMQADRIAELNNGLTLARHVIEQQRKMIGILRAQLVSVEPSPGADEPGADSDQPGGEGGAE